MTALATARSPMLAVQRSEECGHALESWVDLELGRQVGRGLRGGAAWAVENAAGLSLDQASVLVALGLASGDSWRCEVSLDDLVLRTSLPRRSIQRALAGLELRELVFCGLVEFDRRVTYVLQGGGN